MVRIFRHYLSAKLILIVVVEAFVILLSVRMGLAFPFSGSARDASELLLLMAFSAAFALGILVVMNGVGLYSAEASGKTCNSSAPG